MREQVLRKQRLIYLRNHELFMNTMKEYSRVPQLVDAEFIIPEKLDKFYLRCFSKDEMKRFIKINNLIVLPAKKFEEEKLSELPTSDDFSSEEMIQVNANKMREVHSDKKMEDVTVMNEDKLSTGV